jgi:hypothetical protein
LGDNADMAMIELVDFNELTMVVKRRKKAKSRRGGKAKKADEQLISQLLKLKLQQTLLNNYEDNHSIILKDKLFIVYPFFFTFKV